MGLLDSSTSGCGGIARRTIASRGTPRSAAAAPTAPAPVAHERSPPSGTYARKTPRGTRIARWYCPQSHTTFSLLPDFLAARLPGTLDELEEVVARAERALSLLAAANAIRTDTVALPGAMRWVRPRVRRVHHVLVIVIGLLLHRLARCVAEVAAVRARLHSEAPVRVHPGARPRAPRWRPATPCAGSSCQAHRRCRPGRRHRSHRRGCRPSHPGRDCRCKHRRWPQ